MSGAVLVGVSDGFTSFNLGDVVNLAVLMLGNPVRSHDMDILLKQSPLEPRQRLRCLAPFP